MIDTCICACGDLATTLAEYDDGDVEPVCEGCLQAKKEWTDGPETTTPTQKANQFFQFLPDDVARGE